MRYIVYVLLVSAKLSCDALALGKRNHYNRCAGDPSDPQITIPRRRATVSVELLGLTRIARPLGGNLESSRAAGHSDHLYPRAYTKMNSLFRHRLSAMPRIELLHGR